MQQSRECGEREQTGNRRSAVDRETFEPLTEIVAVGLKHEKFVAEVSDGDVHRHRDNRSEDDGEVEKALRQYQVEQIETGCECEVAEEGVESSDAEIADVPPGVIAVTSIVPAVPAGLKRTIWESESLMKLVTATDPKSTAVAFSRFAPTMVTVVPPAVTPSAGLTPVIVGAAT